MSVELHTSSDAERTPIAAAPLAAWATAARQASAVAAELLHTPFVPDSLRARRTSTGQTDTDLERITVGNITAAILTGQELGLQPMAALRSMDVIQGTPALRAITLRALVQSHGHEIWLQESTASRAIVCGRRAGSEQVQSSTWTLDRARSLALLNKDNWRKQPAAMLVARATAEICRLIAADAILALPLAVEELQDADGTVPVSPEPPNESQPATSRRTARRATPPPAATPRADAPTQPPPAPPEPDFDEPAANTTPPAPPEPAGEPEPAGITRAQSTKLHALFGDYEITNRAEKLAVVSAALGRQVASSKDVTKDEAIRLIDLLDTTLTAARSHDADPRAELDLALGLGGEQ